MLSGQKNINWCRLKVMGIGILVHLIGVCGKYYNLLYYVYMPTKAILDSYTVRELKLEISKRNIKRYSASKREDIVKLIMDNKERFHDLTHNKPKPKLTPKPKPKPKPKPTPKPAPDPTSIKASFTLEDALDVYDKKKLDHPVPFFCDNPTRDIYFVSVMNNNSNDCTFHHGGHGLFTLQYTDKKNGLGVLKNEPILKAMAKRYLECKKNKKALCISTERPGHENMLIFNYTRDEVERFEPHGAGFKGREDKLVNDNFKILVDKLNEYIPTKDKLRYVPPHEICPIGFKSFQRHENADMQKTKYKSKEFGSYNVLVTKDSGYCCAWSWFYLDLRLKNLSLTGNEIYTRTIAKVQQNPLLLKKYIRGLINDLFTILTKILKTIQKKHGFPSKVMALYIMKMQARSKHQYTNEDARQINIIYREVKEIVQNDLLKAIKA